MSSETSKHRAILAPWCKGLGLDVGFGGDPIVPGCLTMDLAKPYTRVGHAPQLLQGDCRNLAFLCDASLDWIYQAHLLEDFSYPEIASILAEFRRVLKPAGHLVCCNPDEREYREWCYRHGQAPNEHHRNPDFSLDAFVRLLHVAAPGQWQTVFSCELAADYSFLLVLQK